MHSSEGEVAGLRGASPTSRRVERVEDAPDPGKVGINGNAIIRPARFFPTSTFLPNPTASDHGSTGAILSRHATLEIGHLVQLVRLQVVRLDDPGRRQCFLF